MNEHERNQKEAIVREYRDEALALARYLPWFESKRGESLTGIYEGENGIKTIPLPVYDSKLLAFVKEAQAGNLMDRNYPYVYSRNQIRTHADEQRLIAQARLKDFFTLQGILSKYVLEGMRRSTVWTVAVQEELFLNILKQFTIIFDQKNIKE
ncbi:MAG: hypothetical protein GX567_02025 [Clostridia bacterium]|nr:hypothetical protein [Clostridia bacterium]